MKLGLDYFLAKSYVEEGISQMHEIQLPFFLDCLVTSVDIIISAVRSFVFTQYEFRDNYINFEYFLFSGYERFATDIQMMIGKKPHIYYKVTLHFISPLVLVVCITTNHFFTC